MFFFHLFGIKNIKNNFLLLRYNYTKENDYVIESKLNYTAKLSKIS